MHYYVPSFSALNKIHNLGDHHIKEDILKKLKQAYFDEDWYFNKYPDLHAIQDWDKTSLFNHYIHKGWWEGRMPYQINVQRNFMKEHYSEDLLSKKNLRYTSYKQGFISFNPKIDLDFYNAQFEKDNFFHSEKKAMKHYLKLGFISLKKPNDF
jgi:hypothetical protein